MNKYVIVINAGSSSIKFASYLVNPIAELIEDVHGEMDGIGTHPHLKVSRPNGGIVIDSPINGLPTLPHQNCLAIICSWLMEHVMDGVLVAVGHRVVHGGITYSIPVLVDTKVLNDLEHLIPLAPLHQPHNLLAIRAFQEIMPELPQVACFDTAFHLTQPEFALYTGLPKHYFDEGIRRYGFHGLSYEYITSVLPTLDIKLANARVIVAHLGNGASLCALSNSRSVATTMGFSPVDGLLMGTRCGNLDPGVILYLMNQHHLDAKRIENLLYYESGLLGISGLSSDMRVLLGSKKPDAQTAIGLFIYRIRREIGSLVAALGGLDALIFTGGIGENSVEVRSRVCKDLGWLGIEIDTDANKASATRISTASSKLSTWVVPTNENLMIALHTKRLLKLSP